jgi:DNA-binding transcriptional MerR regulator
VIYSIGWRVGVGLFVKFQKRPVDAPELSGTIRSSAIVSKRDLGEMFKTKKTRPVALPSEGHYTSNDVARISGVSLRQLQWWDERKVVSPRQDGHKRVYIPEEVVEISVIAELRRKGFSLQKIRRVLKYLQKEMGKRLGDALASESDVHLLTDGKSIFLEESPDRIVDLLKNARQPMFLVCVTDQVRRFAATPLRKPAKSETAGAVRKARAL